MIVLAYRFFDRICDYRDALLEVSEEEREELSEDIVKYIGETVPTLREHGVSERFIENLVNALYP